MECYGLWEKTRKKQEKKRKKEKKSGGGGCSEYQKVDLIVLIALVLSNKNAIKWLPMITIKLPTQIPG